MWSDSFPGYIHDELSDLFFKDQTELTRLQSFRKLLCKLCKQEFKQFKQFKEHISLFHALKLCDQCIQNNKLFPSEQVLYSEEDFGIHKINQHVQCELCFSFHYDQRELLVHIKSQHFFCELCPVEKRTAFLNYQELEGHYKKAHYLCEVQMCRDMQNIVFMVYDDLKDHYRSEHPTLRVPALIPGFKIGEDEEASTNFDDAPIKNYSAPKINERNKDFEFPALAPATHVEKKPMDYTKIKKNKPFTPDSNYPALQNTGIQSAIPQPIAKNKGKKEKKEKKEKKASNPGLTDLEKNIQRLNNNHMSSDQFIEWAQIQGLVVDSNFIGMLRNKILSNSDREKIIGALSLVKSNKKSNIEKKIEEEKKIEPKKIEIKSKTESKNFTPENFPALGNAKKIVPKTIAQSVLENIVILNNGLINCGCFAENLISIVPRNEINDMKKLIRAKVRADRIDDVMRSIDYNLLITAFSNEYPSLS